MLINNIVQLKLSNLYKKYRFPKNKTKIVLINNNKNNSKYFLTRVFDDNDDCDFAVAVIVNSN